jgi:hypothetical protein
VNGDGLQSVYLAELPEALAQALVILPEVREKLLDAWGIDAGALVGKFPRAHASPENSHLGATWREASAGQASESYATPRQFPVWFPRANRSNG